MEPEQVARGPGEQELPRLTSSASARAPCGAARHAPGGTWRRSWRLGTPELVDQPVRGDDLVGVQGEDCQQRTLLQASQRQLLVIFADLERAPVLRLPRAQSRCGGGIRDAAEVGLGALLPGGHPELLVAGAAARAAPRRVPRLLNRRAGSACVHSRAGCAAIHGCAPMPSRSSPLRARSDRLLRQLPVAIVASTPSGRSTEPSTISGKPQALSARYGSSASYINRARSTSPSDWQTSVRRVMARAIPRRGKRLAKSSSASSSKIARASASRPRSISIEAIAQRRTRRSPIRN